MPTVKITMLPPEEHRHDWQSHLPNAARAIDFRNSVLIPTHAKMNRAGMLSGMLECGSIASIAASGEDPHTCRHVDPWEFPMQLGAIQAKVCNAPVRKFVK